MNLQADYTRWRRRRGALIRMESMRRPARPSQWQDSDDDAFGLLEWAVGLVQQIADVYAEHTDDNDEWDSGNSIAEEVHELLIRNGYSD